MSQMTKSNNDNNTNEIVKIILQIPNNDNWHEPVVRLRGLPYNSSKEDVIRFFDGTYSIDLIKDEEKIEIFSWNIPFRC